MQPTAVVEVTNCCSNRNRPTRREKIVALPLVSRPDGRYPDVTVVIDENILEFQISVHNLILDRRIRWVFAARGGEMRTLCRK